VLGLKFVIGGGATARCWCATLSALGPLKRRPPRQHLVQHASQAVEVAAEVDRLGPAGLLGAHVGGGADRDAGPGHPLAPGLAHRPGDAEIGQERMVLGQEDVLRLDVAMDQSLPMRVLEGVRHLTREADRLGQPELLLAREPFA
jgi:hypothetical protein